MQAFKKGKIVVVIIEVRFQPARINAFGLPISIAQLLIVPLSSLTSR